jgi:hypothetical protein
MHFTQVMHLKFHHNPIGNLGDMGNLLRHALPPRLFPAAISSVVKSISEGTYNAFRHYAHMRPLRIPISYGAQATLHSTVHINDPQ